MLINLTPTMPDTNEVKKALEAKFLNKDAFADAIEHLVLDTGMNYIDAIVEYCSKNNIEIESIGKLVSKPLKEKLRYDATVLNYLKGSSNASKAKLPF